MNCASQPECANRRICLRCGSIIWQTCRNQNCPGSVDPLLSRLDTLPKGERDATGTAFFANFCPTQNSSTLNCARCTSCAESGLKRAGWPSAVFARFTISNERLNFRYSASSSLNRGKPGRLSSNLWPRPTAFAIYSRFSNSCGRRVCSCLFVSWRLENTDRFQDCSSARPGRHLFMLLCVTRCMTDSSLSGSCADTEISRRKNLRRREFVAGGRWPEFCLPLFETR